MSEENKATETNAAETNAAETNVAETNATETNATEKSGNNPWMVYKALFLLTDYICKIIQYHAARHAVQREVERRALEQKRKQED